MKQTHGERKEYISKGNNFTWKYFSSLLIQGLFSKERICTFSELHVVLQCFLILGYWLIIVLLKISDL